MYSHYSFTVALNGKHFFSTDEKSGVHRSDYLPLYAVLKQKFPESEGYEVCVTYCKVTQADREKEMEEMSKEYLLDCTSDPIRLFPKDALTISYLDKDGERRQFSGSDKAVRQVLKESGYTIKD